MSALNRLEIAIKLSFPVISINTFELARAEQLFKEVSNSVGKGFAKMKFKALPDPSTLKSIVDEHSKKGHDKGVVIFDPYFFDRVKLNPEVMPALKSTLDYMEQEGINYVVAGKESMSDEFAYHVDLPSMNDGEIKDLLMTCEGFVDESGVFSDDERMVIVNNAKGLSHTQMKNVFTYSAFLRYKGEEHLEEIRREKAHILREVGLDVMESMSLEDVGGLDNLKDFLNVRQIGWNNPALPVKGVLLAGVPGGGKTLVAKATAGIFGSTLVRLDMGRFYSKYLGETERQFNRALKTIEEISPVVVLIDEIEKFFSFGEGEHEVSKRLLGNFLYWLQERKDKVFIVATANRIHSLPPELMRAGRWDRAFFIDLPTEVERTKIFEIHLNKHQTKVDEFTLMRLVKATTGYTGAEIEQAVTDSLYLLASRNDGETDSVSNDERLEALLEAIKDITPTSETRKEDIDRIRSLKEQGFYLANAAADKSGAAGPERKVTV